MVVFHVIIVEKIHEDLVIVDKAACNERIWESLVAHRVVVDLEQSIDV
jgi:flagellar biosynthesis regulator FlbT